MFPLASAYSWEGWVALGLKQVESFSDLALATAMVGSELW